MQLELSFQPANNSLANKIDSYYSSEVKKKKLTQKQLVYYAIKKLGIASDREIAAETGIARHLIPDRRKSLGKLICVAYTARDTVTNKLVNYYKLSE